MKRNDSIKPAKANQPKQPRNGSTSRQHTTAKTYSADTSQAEQSSNGSTHSHSEGTPIAKNFDQQLDELLLYRNEHPEIVIPVNGKFTNGKRPVEPYLIQLDENYAYDMYGFYQEIFPDRPLRDWQANELKRQRDALQDNRKKLRYANAAGKGAGKTDLLAIDFLWHVVCHQDSSTLLIANTGRQVDEVPWDRITQLVYQSVLDDYFRVYSNKIVHRHIETWKGITLRAQHDRVESLHGHHANFLAIFVDEASGVHDRVLDTLESGLTDEHGYMFLFSNPTRLQGYFRRCFPGGRHASTWLTANIDTRTVPEVNQTHIQEQFEKYDCNDDHPYFRMFVRGLFPLSDKHQFFTEELLEKARNRQEIVFDSHPYIIGIDPSLGGPSKTAICVRQGGKIHHMESFIAKHEESASRCYEICARYKQYNPIIIIEGGAVGEGFIVAFKPYTKLYDLSYIVFLPNNVPNERADIYVNVRTAMYGVLRDALQDFLKLDNAEIEGQLLEMLFTTNYKSQFVLESKDDMASRGMASPDEADALAFTFIKNFPPKIKKPVDTDRPIVMSKNGKSGGWRHTFSG